MRKAAPDHSLTSAPGSPGGDVPLGAPCASDRLSETRTTKNSRAVLRSRSSSLFWIALAGCLFLALLFPGDAPWINDEPVLIMRALEANGQGLLAKEGLRGSVGIRYSPLPTWFYQGLLLVSKNPVHLSEIKTALALFVILGGLLFLSRRLKLSLWPLLLVFLSPYLYFYNRLLWDNVLAIPLSLMVWCAMTQFWQGRNRWALATAGLLCVILIHVHMMAVLLIIPLGLTFLVLDRQWFRSHPGFTSVLFAALALASLPYLLSALQGIGFSEQNRAPLMDSLLAGAGGSAYFTFLGFADYFLPEICGQGFFLPGILTGLVVWTGWIVHFFCLLGAISGARHIAGRVRRHQEWTAQDRLMALALLIIAFNITFFGITRHPHHPHYFNAVWFAYFYVIWRWLDGAFKKSSRLARALFSVCGVALGVMLPLVISLIHVNGGNQGIHHGPTLGNQVDVAKTILEYSPESPIHNFVPNYDLFPHALYALLRIFQPSPPRKDRPVRQIYLYHGSDPGKGRIYVRVTKRPLDVRAGSLGMKGGGE